MNKPKTFADLKPNAAACARIAQLAPGQTDPDTLAVLPMLVLDGAVTAKFTQHTQAWFEQAARDINGAEGVSLQISHDTQELPAGRLFAAELGANDNGPALSALAFTADKELVEKYLRGDVKAVSAGISGDTFTCSICGNEIWSEACFAAARKADHGYHCPGEKYDEKLCVVVVGVEEGHRALREVSPVYCGASNGKLLPADFLAQMHSYGDVKTVPTAAEAVAMRKLLVNNICTLELDVPVLPPDAAGADEADENAVELTAALADNAALVVENKNLTKAVADVNAELGAALDRETKLQQQITDLSAKLAAAENVAAKIATAALPIKESLRAGANADDMLAALSAFAALAVGLRKWSAARLEKLRVQADGNKAAPPSDILDATDPAAIGAALDAAEKAVCERYNVPPLTGAAPQRRAKSPGAALPDTAFKIGN
jgi:hypothetical protein